MENHHREKIRKRYGKLLDGKRLIVLRIPDNYDYTDPDLVEHL